MTACCHDDDSPDHPRKELERTIIFYMAAENSLASFVSSDSSEIASRVQALPDGCRVVLYMDDTKSSRICVGTNEMPLQTIKIYDRDVCSTDSADMEYVLTDIFKRYPAKSYGLVMWSHASGWVFTNGRQATSAPRRAPRRTFGIDNGARTKSDQGRQMNVTTLANVLSHHPHLDWIFFDACYMQTIEVAYEMKDVADWILGSPAEIPGDGAPYDLVLDGMTSHEALPNLILQTYYDYYVSGLGAMSYAGAILSAIKTSELPALAAATKPLLQRILNGRALLDCTGIQYYCPLYQSEYFTEFYDMANVFYTYADEAEFRQWYSAMERAVPYRYLSPRWSSAYARGNMMRVLDPEHCAAVSMFVPTEFYDNLGWMSNYHKLQWYDAVGMSVTGW